MGCGGGETIHRYRQYEFDNLQRSVSVDKNNKVWMGNGFHAGNAYFSTPDAAEYGEGVYMPETGLVKFRNVCWFTNLDHGRRHQPLKLMSMGENLKFNKRLKDKGSYDRYDNYDAIEVPFTDAIPSDYYGVMGVPVSFLDKHSPEQFEILGYEKSYELRTKVYPQQLQIDKNGKKSSVTKLNDGAAIKIPSQPIGMTYYVVDNEYFIQAYKRIFIRHKK